MSLPAHSETAAPAAASLANSCQSNSTAAIVNTGGSTWAARPRRPAAARVAKAGRRRGMARTSAGLGDGLAAVAGVSE